jgi:hypothetical protein
MKVAEIGSMMFKGQDWISGMSFRLAFLQDGLLLFIKER